MARGNGTKDVQWKNTINAYKGIAAVAIAYFYHYKNEFGGEKNQESHFYRPGVDTISFLIFICMGI